MYDFYDYFDASKRMQPYTFPGEELEDYLRLLDMLLENYLEYKGMHSEQKLYSRGLVITESELSGYFEMPPYYRERDISDPVLTESANAAFAYINSRVKATRELFPDTDLLRVESLRETFSLSRTELMAVLIAFAGGIDRRYERIFGFLQDNINKGTPTLGLLYALMSRITARESAHESIPAPLDERMYTYFFLSKENRDSLDAPLILHPPVRKILTGEPDTDRTDSAAFQVYEEDPGTPLFFEKSGKELSYILSKESGKKAQQTDWKAVYLGNEDGETVLHLLYQACRKSGEKLYVLDMEQLRGLKPEEQQLSLSDLYLRIKRGNGRLAIRYIPREEGDRGEVNEQRNSIHKKLEEIFRICAPKNIFLFGQREEPGDLAAMFIPSIRIPNATAALRTKIWQHFLNPEQSIKIAADVVIPDLADFYEISFGMIRKVVGHATATAQTRRNPVIDRKMILESLRMLNQVDFSGLATYVRPVYTWDDITISDHQKAILQTACSRCRLRNRIGEGWGLKQKNAYGNGISLLLYGPPGTGKTMAAQVIANELELPLYRVDISQISSKYIGETEKNLAMIFNAASKANVILFFDEADALFAKRTEVSDSHDKYANNETAFLLQKIEEYNGMSILATNYYNNFDDAFVRRITYAVHMESPDKETRYTLWTTILPKTAKISRNIDFRFFADKFELSGSNIKAILFNAAYMAGAENKPISAEHIVHAMQYEYNKLGKLVNSSEFGDYEKYLLK